MDIVIFDLDGTLFKSETSALPAVQDALFLIGLEPARDDFILSLMGENTKDFSTKLLSEYGNEGLEMYDDFINALWVCEEEHIRSNGQLYEGVEKLLVALEEKGYRMAVCSNGTRAYIDYILKTQNIERFFVRVVSADVPGGKTRCLGELISSEDISRAVMVGDRYHDMEAASSNDIPFIGAAYGFGTEEVKGAEYVAERPGDILRLLEIIWHYSGRHN